MCTSWNKITHPYLPLPTKPAMLAVSTKEEDLVAWINVRDRLPATGAEVLCRLQHFKTEAIQEHKLLKVDEGDCSWRTADDHSEISYSWDVVEWQDDIESAISF